MSLSRRPHSGPVPRTYEWQCRCRDCRQLEIVTGAYSTEAGRNLNALGWRGFRRGRGAYWLCGTCLAGQADAA